MKAYETGRVLLVFLAVSWIAGGYVVEKSSNIKQTSIRHFSF